VQQPPHCNRHHIATATTLQPPPCSRQQLAADTKAFGLRALGKRRRAPFHFSRFCPAPTCREQSRAILACCAGRLPIRVELKGLVEADLLRILTEPQFNLIRQQATNRRPGGPARCARRARACACVRTFEAAIERHALGG
jgi:hypothetical protein